MITLSAVRDYLKARRSASIEEIAWHFDTSPDAARGVLADWQTRRRVRRLASPADCAGSGSGCGCGCKAEEIWEWLETPAPHESSLR